MACCLGSTIKGYGHSRNCLGSRGYFNEKLNTVVPNKLSAELANEFTRGYACAVATLQRIDGSETVTTVIKELMCAGGLTLESCQAAGVDAYDMEVLFRKKDQR